MIKSFFKWVTFLILTQASTAFAEEMVMARITMKADLTYEHLKDKIEEHGYSIAHIQTCDQGMKDFGYKSDLYRVLFFGKIEEVRRISEKHPEFASFVPLKMIVVAEGSSTLLSIVNPQTYLSYYHNDKEMQIQFVRWYNDILSIFNDMQSVVGEKVAVQYVQ